MAELNKSVKVLSRLGQEQVRLPQLDKNEFQMQLN